MIADVVGVVITAAIVLAAWQVLHGPRAVERERDIDAAVARHTELIRLHSDECLRSHGCPCPACTFSRDRWGVDWPVHG
jgi:hypothetical protein